MIRYLFAMMILASPAVAKKASFSGSVMDGSAGIVLEGATVTLQSSGLSTRTNSKGHYSLKGRLTETVAKDSLVVSKKGYGSVTRRVGSYKGKENFVLTQAGKVTFTSSVADAKGTWQIARTVYDPKTLTSKVTWLTDSPQWNFKPNYSPDGKKITFFRRYSVSGDGSDTNLWKTAVCVMNADGSDFHELMNGQETMNTEPYWTRDGSMRVTWNQMLVEYSRLTGIYSMWSAWNGRPGKERRIGGDNWDWLNPHLKDGRMLVKHNGNNYYLMTANPGGGQPTYEKVSYSDKPHNLHKISISQDETRIAYQKHVDLALDSYLGGVMVYADFDASIPAITNEVVFDAYDPKSQAWYVSISTDNRYLVFAKDGRIMQHDAKTGTTMQVTSNSPWRYHAYPTFVTYSK